MAHTITGQIRKAPYVQTGSGQKGDWKMFAVELSESFKDKEGNRQYTNYRAVLFASSPGAISFYEEVLVEGAVISVSSDQLKINQREHDGKVYVTLEPVQPRLVFAQKPADGQQQHHSGTPSQQQQQETRPQTSQQQSAPASDDGWSDKDIPF